MVLHEGITEELSLLQRHFQGAVGTHDREGSWRRPSLRLVDAVNFLIVKEGTIVIGDWSFTLASAC